jgi:hypothetical protein
MQLSSIHKVSSNRSNAETWMARLAAARQVEAVRGFETPAGFQGKVDYATFNLVPKSRVNGIYSNDKTILPTEEPFSTAAMAAAASSSRKVFCTCGLTLPDATSSTISASSPPLGSTV